jgi:hypothetical protein
MTRDSVVRLRYIGVFPQAGYREYRFHIGKADAECRDVSLTIDDSLFGTNKLKFQEAHDLCYQKLLADLSDETLRAPILNRAAVSVTDIDSYRQGHPASGTRKAGFRHHP